MNPEFMKNVPFMPLEVRYWAAGSWSAFESSNVNDTIVPVAAFAGDAPPTTTIIPSTRRALIATFTTPRPTNVALDARS
jgi:hypothetical protein